MSPARNARLARAACPLLLLLLLATCAPAQPQNLIVVLVDTLRADHLGFHGYERETSPRIDELARRSVVFENHHSHASRTGPSVATLFTGLHPRSHGVVNPLTHWDAKGTLADEQTTLAEILTRRGYRCRGLVANINVSPHFGFGQGFEAYDYVRSESARDVNRHAFAFLEDAKRKRTPFFLYLHYMEPHSPYDTPGPYAESYVDRSYSGPVTGGHEQLDEIVAGKLTLDEADVDQLEALYDREIRFFDDRFGELLSHLEEQSLHDDTLLLFVSDHGEEFLEHDSVLHGYTLYEEQLHVPCFVFDPRSKSAGRVEAATRHVDLLPTLLERLGVDYDGAVQGRSLVGLMDGGDEGSAGPLLAEASLRAVHTIAMRSLTTDGWKLIETTLPRPRVELYRLRDDPEEQRDLVYEQPDVAAQMLEHLRARVQSLPVGRGGVVTLTKQEKARLRALGYLD